MVKFNPLSNVCPEVSNLMFEKPNGCRHKAILANKLCDLPIQMGNVYFRINNSKYNSAFYECMYFEHYWCVEDKGSDTIIYDSLEELKRACVNYMSTSVENMILSKNVTFLKKEVSNIKVTEISGEKWIGRKPNEFLDYLAKTFRNSNVDLIYVTDLMHDYVDPSKFMSKINQDNEYNVMYDTIGKWLDGLDLSSPMYIGEEDHIGVEMEWDLNS
jgi:hypothetical protein